MFVLTVSSELNSYLFLCDMYLQLGCTLLLLFARTVLSLGMEKMECRYRRNDGCSSSIAYIYRNWNINKICRKMLLFPVSRFFRKPTFCIFTDYWTSCLPGYKSNYLKKKKKAKMKMIVRGYKELFVIETKNGLID